MKSSSRKVYVLSSQIDKDSTLIFGTFKRAQNYVLGDNRLVFPNSKAEDFYITSRVVF